VEDDLQSKKEEDKTLNSGIAELEVQLGDLDTSAKKAKDLRDEQNQNFENAKKDLESTIAAIKNATMALQDAKGGFMEVAKTQIVQSALEFANLADIPPKDRDMVAMLLQEEPLLAHGDEAKHIKKYSFKSGNIIELLKSLLGTFEKELSTAIKEETNSQNAYDLAKQARDASSGVKQQSKDEKTQFSADIKGDIAQLESSKKSTTEDLEVDSKSLGSAKTSCIVKKQEWQERSAVREAELEALTTAINILSKVTGISTKAPQNPVPPTSPLEEKADSFLQIDDPRTMAIKLLKQHASITHSLVLERLAQELSLHVSEPFDKVINMIQKMMFRLMDEQREEDEHKSWCEKEVKKTNVTIEHKEDKVDDTSLKINSARARAQGLINDIRDAEHLVSKMVSHMKEATEIRDAGKDENAKALADAQDAQRAIAQAISVIKSFYKDTGAVELLQRDPVSLPNKPANWESQYTGAADPMNQPDGIISVLQKTASEFATMEADTRAQEETDQKDYDEDMKNSEIEKARRSKEAEIKGQERRQLLSKIDSLTSAKKHTDKELGAVSHYLKDLEPACMEGDATYETRKAARTDEIKSLKQVQGILGDAYKEEKSLLQNKGGVRFLAVSKHQ